MKGFQWNKLRTRHIQNTIWVKVKYDKYHAVLPYAEIEDLFAAAVIEEKAKGTINVILIFFLSLAYRIFRYWSQEECVSS